MRYIIFLASILLPSPVVLATGLPVLFSVDSGRTSGEYTRMTFEGNDRWYETHYWNGPEFARIGPHWMHPGADNDVVRTFEVPRDGKVRVVGNVRKLHLDGDGVVASVLYGGDVLWKGEIDGKDGTGIDHAIDVEVARGNFIRFELNRRGNHFCDTTSWNPSVTYTDGERFEASEHFSGEQGQGHWFHELKGKVEHAPSELTFHADLNSLYRSLCEGISRCPDVEMLPLVLSEWLQEDGFHWTFPALPAQYALLWFGRPEGYLDFPDLQEITPEKLVRCSEKYLDGAASLLNDYRNRFSIDLDVESRLLETLRRELSTATASQAESQRIYIRSRLLRRSVFLSHPGVPSSELLFAKRRTPSYSHLVGQYFGWRQRAGGGLYILENPGYSLKTRCLTEGKLPEGNYLEPRLSYDARRIAFSFVEPPRQVPDGQHVPVNEEGDEEHYFHLYEMNVDGGNLRQLTGDRYDDMMPEYLPDGGLAFVSTRRKSYSRCFGHSFGRRWHSYTLFRMDADGHDRLDPERITQISFNDVNEWFPAVANSGLLMFARWDYIDRDAVTHQNLWTMRADGTNPVAVWGNAAPNPHCMFQAKAIPDSNKIVFIASAHHSITAGPVCLVDPTVDANSLDAVTRITPGPFPEAESCNTPEYYNSPWPLGEDLFIVAYSPSRLIYEPNPNTDNALGLYLLDDQGNREVLYRDKSIGSTCPIPIVSRPVPPVVTSARNEALTREELGEMSIIDVYEGLGDVPRGSLKELRIVQIFPKTSWIVNEPRIGAAGEENTRAVLGVVPIEADGSAKFLVPSGKPLLFQVLDEDGFAYQTMRSTTSVMPGEQVSCVGCHEDRMSAATRPASLPSAFKGKAARLQPTPESGRPFGFVEMVQPILDAKCVECHNGEKAEGGYDLSRNIVQHGHTASYAALCREFEMVPRFVERNQIQQTEPGGNIGARGSKLIRLLKSGHEGVELTREELRRIGTWIDLNAVFYGAYDQESTELQRNGKPISMPTLQ